MNRLILPAAALLAAALPGFAQAQDATQLRLPNVDITGQRVDPARYAVPNATTATRTDAPLMELPVSVQVVPQQVLRDQQVLSAEQATANVSNVGRTSVWQGGNSNEFVIRGFRSNEQVFVDGLRLQSQNFGAFDLANIDHVEVLKGPASMLYGRIEPGGMVNLVPFRPSAEPSAYLQQQFGSFNLFRTTAGATGRLTEDGRLTYRIDGAFTDSGSFRNYVHNRSSVIAPQLEWRPDNQTQVNVFWTHQDIRRTNDNIGFFAYGNRSYRMPLSRFLGEPTDFTHSQQDLVGLSVRRELNTNWAVRLRLTAHSQREQDGGVFGDFVADSDVQAGILPRYGVIGLGERGVQNTSLASAELTGRVVTGPLTHNLIFGTDYTHIQSKSLCCGIWGQNPDGISIAAPVYGATIGPVDPTQLQNSHARTDWNGVFAQDRIALPYNLHLLMGVRYDVANSASAVNQQAGDTKSSAHESRPSGRVGLLWQARPWLALYGSYVNSFGSTNAPVMDRNNRILPAESAEQYEAGVKFAPFGERLFATVTWFRLTKHNIATADPLYPNDYTHGLVIGAARSTGVELDVVGEIRTGWRVIAAYTNMQTRMLTDTTWGNAAGAKLPNAPNNAGRLFTTYQFQDARANGLTLGGGATAVGKRQGNYANDYQLPAYATLDLMARQPFQIGERRFSAQLNFNNVTNARYWQAGGETTRARIQAGAPFAVLAAIRVDL